MKTSRTFAPQPGSIPQARRFVLAAVGAMTAEQRDAVSVMVSEIAMNAVEHARTSFHVSVEVARGLLRVEVADSDAGAATAQPVPKATSPRGRGLFIVDRLSDAWGTESAAGPSKVVWFTVAIDPVADPAV